MEFLLISFRKKKMFLYVRRESNSSNSGGIKICCVVN